MFGTDLVPDTERDSGNKTNRYSGRQLERRDVKRVDPSAHDVGHPCVLADVIGEYQVLKLGHGVSSALA